MRTRYHAHSRGRSQGGAAGGGAGGEEMSELSEMALRVRALEAILTEKGDVDALALDRIVQTCETRIGPQSWRRRSFQPATDAPVG